MDKRVARALLALLQETTEDQFRDASWPTDWVPPETDEEADKENDAHYEKYASYHEAETALRAILRS